MKSNTPDSAPMRAEIGSTTPKEREEQHSAAWPQQCPDPSKCYGVGCHGCEEPHISKMAPGVKMPAPSSAARCPYLWHPARMLWWAGWYLADAIWSRLGR